MKFTSIELRDKSNGRCAISNKFNNYFELSDAVEDATTWIKAEAAIEQMCREDVQFSRKTDSYIRYKLTDRLGNQHYLIFNF